MKLINLFLLFLLIASFAIAQDDAAEDAGDADAGGDDSDAEKHVFTVNIKKAKRRTGTDVLKDIQSDPDGIVNVVVFFKEDPANKISSKNNNQEISMYEKFFKQLEDGWDGCEVKKDFTVDVVEVTDALSEELLEKLNIKGDFKKRTMVMPMTDGTGVKIQGPTAYQKLAEHLVENEYLTEGDEGKCTKAFFDFVEEEGDDADAGAGGEDAAEDADEG